MDLLTERVWVGIENNTNETSIPMIPKYHVEYTMRLGRHEHMHHLQTDEPVACEEFLLELLDRGFLIKSIKHEGVPLSQHESDRMIKTAASMLASRRLCNSLDIGQEEERYRFGFSS